MVNLCLTSKHLHEITVRQLYKEVTLEVGSATDTKLIAFLNPGNIGIPYVRKIDIFLANVLDSCNQLQQAHFAIRMILEYLPANSLEKFSWHPWSAFSQDNLILLYKKQKRLTWLEGISVEGNVLPDLQKLPDFDRNFENVRKLGLYPDSREVLEFCNLLVKKTSKIDKITLHASFDDSEVLIPSRELNDSSTGPGLLSGTIFGHMQPFEKCTPISLTDLTLQKISLRYSPNTYAKIFDFLKIKSLRILSCPGADALIAELTKVSKLPEKLETFEFKHEDNEENDGMNAADGFLCLVSGIKVLTLDLTSVKGVPPCAGITRHGKTVRELIIHATNSPDEDEHIYDLESFDKICKACEGLEQLSVGFPSMAIARTNNDSFTAFEVALGQLPHLITLNITTWPNYSPSSPRLPRKVYEHLLQGMAQEGFEHSIDHATTLDRSSRLAVIAFGSSDKVYVREESKNQIIFVKGKQVDPLGREGPIAIQIGWCLRKYVEPRSDVLDFSLSRSTRPPVRESPPSDDSD